MILGLDPTTNFGYAVLNMDGTRKTSGTWALKTLDHEGGGMRYVRFRLRMTRLFAQYRIKLVAYELVARHKGTHAAHLYGAWQANIQEMCETREIPVVGLPVKQVKKYATDNGNAGKEAMLQAARDRWGPVGDDNEADALWIAMMALETYGEGI